jgi:hypothetical protein
MTAFRDGRVLIAAVVTVVCLLVIVFIGLLLPAYMD